MTVLGRQLEAFAADARFFDAVLGLIGMGRRIDALSSVRRSDDGLGPDGDLADFFLGILSATRTLEALLGVMTEVSERNEKTAPPPVALAEVLSLR